MPCLGSVASTWRFRVCGLPSATGRRGQPCTTTPRYRGGAENAGHPECLLHLAELEFIDCHQRMVERRVRAARFPAVRSLYTFDFPAIPSLNKAMVMELARCEYVLRRENVIAVGNSDTGKTAK